MLPWVRAMHTKKWILSVLLTALGLITIGTTVLTAGVCSPRFCSSCHIMKPQAMTGQASAHSKIECVKCHSGSGLGEIIKTEWKVLQRIYLVSSGKYLLPVEIKEPVDNSVCLSCHTFTRTVTPRNDIIVPHALHVQAGVRCMDCHQGIAHGRIAQRQMTIDGDFQRWTPELGAQQMKPENLRIGMNDCIECHRKEDRGAKTCQDCHTKISTTPSHEPPQTWLQGHGLAAAQDLKSCDECHNYTNISGEPTTGTNIFRYPRQNDFCQSCHLKRPEQHSGTWIYSHSQSMRTETNLCLVCHDLNEPPAGEQTGKTYCSRCHRDNLGSAFFKRAPQQGKETDTHAFAPESSR